MRVFKIILLLLVIASCNRTPGNEAVKKSVETQTDSMSVTKSELTSEDYELGKLTKINFGESIRVNGMIDVPAQNKSVISHFMGGYIDQTPLILGDKVSKGQFLVSIQNPEFIKMQQEYLQQSEQLVFLKAEYDRKKQLFEEKITSKKKYLLAQSTYKSLLAQHVGLKKILQLLHINPEEIDVQNPVSKVTIYSPIEGYVTKVNANHGSHVSANDAILEIVNTDHIHLELNVFEKDVMKVKKGQKIKFQIPESSTQVFDANVHLVGSIVDETSRRVKVHAHVASQHKFIVGMYVNATIHLANDLAYALPKRAIKNDDQGTFVLVVEEENKELIVFQKKYVALGKQNETYVEILKPESLMDDKILLNDSLNNY
jgi:cobalt-zinc-cadmium efflux system membrane fusion protein